MSELDKFYIYLSVGGMICISFFLWNEDWLLDYRPMAQITQHKPLGVVSSKDNQVSKRLEKSFVWFDLHAGNAVFENETLYSGTDSQAVLAMNHNISLEMSPNSLVQLLKSRANLFIDLNEGSVKLHFNKQGTVTLKHRDEMIDVLSIRGGPISIYKDSKGTLFIQSNKRDMKITLKNQSHTYKAHELVSVDQKMILKKDNFDLKLESPLPGELIWKDLSDSIQFQWEGHEQIANYRLQVASDFQFKKIVFDLRNIPNRIFFTPLKPDHQYYWRISNEDKVLSPTQQFKYISSLPPKLLFPLPSAQIASALGSENFVDFQWTRKFGIQDSEIQISSNSSFSEILYEKITPLSSVTKVPLPVGTYYWRVRASYEHVKKGKWSHIRTLSTEVHEKNERLTSNDHF